MDFKNSYEDQTRAEAYATLEFSGTYYLAFRDLPQIISKYSNGTKALDFGCGAGRSTRFLKDLGYNTVGVDISQDMINQAIERNETGKYILVGDGNLNELKDNSYDVILSAFTFDNIPTRKKKINLFSEMRRVLKKDGVLINLVSSPDIYLNEWSSFTTKMFDENKTAKCGDIVRTMMKDVEDKRPIDDVLWPDKDYKDVYKKAQLELVDTFKPLANENEDYDWVNETKIAPWVIYVLKK